MMITETIFWKRLRRMINLHKKKDYDKIERLGYVWAKDRRNRIKFAKRKENRNG